MAGYGNVLAVAADDVFHNVQTQTPAVSVLGAAFIQLVEAVKYQRQLFWRNGLAIVAYANIGLSFAFPDGQIQHTAGMDASAMIISINTDENAPISKIADYAITGKVEEVIPKMIKYYKQNSK